MGLLFSLCQSEEVVNPKKAVKKNIDENDQAVMRVKLHRDQIMLKRNDLQKKVTQTMQTIKQLVREKRKEEAVYYLGKKRILEKSLQGISEKLRYVEARISRIEDVQDQAEFTQIMKDSNQVLRTLMDKVDVEAIQEAAELDRAINMNNEEVMAEINKGLEDPALMEEYDALDRDVQVVNDSELDRQVRALVEDKKKYEDKPREERELAYN